MVGTVEGLLGMQGCILSSLHAQSCSLWHLQTFLYAQGKLNPVHSNRLLHSCIDAFILDKCWVPTFNLGWNFESELSTENVSSGGYCHTAVSPRIHSLSETRPWESRAAAGREVLCLMLSTETSRSCDPRNLMLFRTLSWLFAVSQKWFKLICIRILQSQIQKYNSLMGILLLNTAEDNLSFKIIQAFIGVLWHSHSTSLV